MRVIQVNRKKCTFLSFLKPFSDSKPCTALRDFFMYAWAYFPFLTFNSKQLVRISSSSTNLTNRNGYVMRTKECARRHFFTFFFLSRLFVFEFSLYPRIYKDKFLFQIISTGFVFKNEQLKCEKNSERDKMWSRWCGTITTVRSLANARHCLYSLRHFPVEINDEVHIEYNQTNLLARSLATHI